MKCFTLFCTRRQYAYVLAWCRDTNVDLYGIAAPAALADANALDEPQTYVAYDINELVSWYGTFDGNNRAGFNVFVNDTDYALMALRWPQYHLCD